MIADRLSMHELGNLVTILLIIMMILCLLRLFFQTLKKPLQASFYLIILFLVLAIVVMGLRLNEIYQTNPAIVVVSEAHAHFEPSVSGEVHYKLREGERVDIKGEYDGWVAVERWDGKKGYLKETEIIPIRVEKKE